MLRYDKTTDLNYFFVLSGALSYLTGLMNFSFRNVLCGFYFHNFKVIKDLRIGVGDEPRWINGSASRFSIYPTHCDFDFDECMIRMVVGENRPSLSILIEMKDRNDLTIKPVACNRKIHLWQNFGFTFFMGYRGKKMSDRDGILFSRGDCWCAIKVDPKPEILDGVARVINADRVLIHILAGEDEGVIDEVKKLDFDEIMDVKRRRLAEILERSEIQTPDERLNQAIQWAKIATEMNYHEFKFGEGYFAGLPRFPAFWGRDSGWIGFAPLFYGRMDRVKKMLGMFINAQRDDGKIPNYVSSTRRDYSSIDSQLLLGILAYYYYRWSGDGEFIRSIWKSLLKAADYVYSRDVDGDHLPETSCPITILSEAWMDFSIRWGSEIDVAGEWCFFLQKLAELCRELNLPGDPHRWEETSRIVREKINGDFWNSRKQFFYDLERRFPLSIFGRYDSSLTINCMVPILYDLVDWDKRCKVYDRLMDEGFMTPWGIRCRSKENPFYMGGNHSLAYHYGMVWPFTNAWVLWASLRDHQTKLGFRLLDVFKLLTEANTPGAINETVPGDFFDASDCPVQTWSSALFFAAVMGGLCGIEVNAPKREFVVNPHMKDEWNFLRIRRVRVGDDEFSVEYIRTEKGFKVKVVCSGEWTATIGVPLSKGSKPDVTGGEWKLVENEWDAHVMVKVKLQPGVEREVTVECS